MMTLPTSVIIWVEGRWTDSLHYLKCDRLLGASSPVEGDIPAGLDLADSRVVAHGAPDLLTKLTFSNIVAVRAVV